MPVYNGARFLGQAIRSILSQTFPDFELVVVDDGSTDATPAILHRWATRDPRVRILRQPHLGLVEALNTGWLACRAPVIARMDADDLSTPERLERQFQVLEQRTEIGVVTCAAILIDERGHELGTTGSWDPSQGIAAFLAGNPVVHGSVMIRRASVRRQPPYTRAPEDYRLWVELLAQGVQFAGLDEPLYAFRVHTGRYSIWSARSQLRGVMEVQLELLERVKPTEVPNELLARAWESVAVAAHAIGRRRLASRAHRHSERLRQTCSAGSAGLRTAVQAYGWARMPWHWYDAKAIRLLRTDGRFQTFRTILLNHPMLAWASDLRAALRKSSGGSCGSARAAPAQPLRSLPPPSAMHGARVLVIGEPPPRAWEQIVQSGPAEVTLAGCTQEPTIFAARHCPIPVRVVSLPVDPGAFDVVVRLDGTAA